MLADIRKILEYRHEIDDWVSIHEKDDPTQILGIFKTRKEAEEYMKSHVFANTYIIVKTFQKK